MDALAAGAQLLSEDPSAADHAAGRLRALAILLRGASDAVVRAAPTSWSGAGRDASAGTATRLARQLATLAAACQSVGLALAASAAALESAQAEARAARRVLGSAGPQVRDAVAGQLGAAVQAFDDADRRAAALIADAFLRRLVTPPLSALAPPGRAERLTVDETAASAIPRTPAALAVWWAGLSKVARGQLTATWTRSTGPPDGVPATVRDAVNRRRLANALSNAQRDYQRTLHRDLRGHLTTAVERLAPWPLSWVVHSFDTASMAAARRVAALRALTQALQAPGSELLVFDPGGDGRAVVASTDVDADRTIAVLVPGMNTDLADVPRLAAELGRLVAIAGPATAVVTWLGYDAPSTLQVASDAKAKAGAAELETFTEGLRAAGAQRQHLTVIGHSYGTLVAGIAARRGLPADDLVLLGSPGVEASRATQLRLTPGHVWAARAASDPIQLVFWPDDLGELVGIRIPEIFGPDPTSATFGARGFGVGGAYGHSGYFTPGSESLANLGRIVSGRTVPS